MQQTQEKYATHAADARLAAVAASVTSAALRMAHYAWIGKPMVDISGIQTKTPLLLF